MLDITRGLWYYHFSEIKQILLRQFLLFLFLPKESERLQNEEKFNEEIFAGFKLSVGYGAVSRLLWLW